MLSAKDPFLWAILIYILICLRILMQSSYSLIGNIISQRCFFYILLSLFQSAFNLHLPSPFISVLNYLALILTLRVCHNDNGPSHLPSPGPALVPVLVLVLAGSCLMVTIINN